MSSNIKERAKMFEEKKTEENKTKEIEKKKKESSCEPNKQDNQIKNENNNEKEKNEKNQSTDSNINTNQQEGEKGKTEETNNINKTNNDSLQKEIDPKKLEENKNNNDDKKEDKEKNKTNKKYKEIPIVVHESEKPIITFEEIDSRIPYHSIGTFLNSIPTKKKYQEIPIVTHDSQKPSIVFEEINSGINYHSNRILLNSIPTKKKYKEIPIAAHDSQKPSVVFEEINSGKLHSSIPFSKTNYKNRPKDINSNEDAQNNQNVINNNNQNNQNNNNNINFDPALFQQFWQQYLNSHGFENNFVNNYFNLDAFMINDEEKKIIEYYRKSDNCGLPNSLNGCIILNTKTPSLGLQNVGATCYMNATLQCLIHLKELSELLLSGFLFKYPREDENYAKNHRLSLEYINILAQVYFPKLYNASAICFAPYKFKEIIGELNPLFNGYAANDAKDLLQFILETMHQELKMAVQPFMEYYCNQTIEQSAYQYFSDSYISQNQSPLLKYLYGITKIQTKCLNCKTVKFNFQSYNLLYFPLRESKRYCIEMKKKENKDFDESKYILDLYGCFLYNEKIDHFTGDNQMYCNVCKGCQDSDYESFIFSAPSILAIVLNRGRGNQDFQEPFKYSVDIDITKYLKNGQNGKYYLIGMVVHLGESSLAGHFIAYCRMDKESDWYCYNDAFVSKCSNFDEIIEKGTPYILFYHHE